MLFSGSRAFSPFMQVGRCPIHSAFCAEWVGKHDANLAEEVEMPWHYSC